MQLPAAHTLSALALEPWVARRPEQAYVALRARRAEPVERLWDELLDWLGERGLPPAGVPFVRQLEAGGADGVELEVAVPVAAGTAGDGRVRAGVLPAGRWVALVHEGPPDALDDADAALRAWADEHGLALDATSDERRCAWPGRLARVFADRDADGRWETEVAYLVAA